MNLRFPLRGTGRDSPPWLVPLFLLIGVIAPAASILWLTNLAANNEAAAARREVAGAYQGQLRLLRERIDQQWKARTKQLSAAKSFYNAVTEKLADAVIELRPDGSVAYPIASTPLGIEATAPGYPIQGQGHAILGKAKEKEQPTFPPPYRAPPTP